MAQAAMASLAAEMIAFAHLPDGKFSLCMTCSSVFEPQRCTSLMWLNAECCSASASLLGGSQWLRLP